jgi:hypothetical protein
MAGRHRGVIMAAEDRGPLMHARTGMLLVLNRHVGAGVQPRPERPTLETYNAGDDGKDNDVA